MGAPIRCNPIFNDTEGIKLFFRSVERLLLKSPQSSGATPIGCTLSVHPNFRYQQEAEPQDSTIARTGSITDILVTMQLMSQASIQEDTNKGKSQQKFGPVGAQPNRYTHTLRTPIGHIHEPQEPFRLRQGTPGVWRCFDGPNGRVSQKCPTRPTILKTWKIPGDADWYTALHSSLFHLSANGTGDAPAPGLSRTLNKFAEGSDAPEESPGVVPIRHQHPTQQGIRSGRFWATPRSRVIVPPEIAFTSPIE